MIIGAGVTF